MNSWTLVSSSPLLKPDSAGASVVGRFRNNTWCAVAMLPLERLSDYSGKPLDGASRLIEMNST